MFRSIFVSFNADFDHYFDAILLEFLGYGIFRSEREVSDVLLHHKDTVKIALVAIFRSLPPRL